MDFDHRKFVLEHYPQARLVTDTKYSCFGVWCKQEYLSCAELSEQRAWEKASQKIQMVMLKKLEA